MGRAIGSQKTKLRLRSIRAQMPKAPSVRVFVPDPRNSLYYGRPRGKENETRNKKHRVNTKYARTCGGHSIDESSA